MTVVPRLLFSLLFICLFSNQSTTTQWQLDHLPPPPPSQKKTPPPYFPNPPPTAHASNTGRRAFQDVGVFALVDEGEADDTIISHQGWTAVTPLSLFWQAGRADVWEGLEAILTA